MEQALCKGTHQSLTCTATATVVPQAACTEARTQPQPDCTRRLCFEATVCKHLSKQHRDAAAAAGVLALLAGTSLQHSHGHLRRHAMLRSKLHG
jgi:hypothetical protein